MKKGLNQAGKAGGAVVLGQGGGGDSKRCVQVIYAHLPPAMVLAGQQHFRAQTSLEQAVSRRWFAREDQQGGGWDSWLRKEREVVNQLCEALLRGNVSRSRPTAAFE